MAELHLQNPPDSTSAANQRLLIREGLFARKMRALSGFADYAMPSVIQSLQVSEDNALAGIAAK